MFSVCKLAMRVLLGTILTQNALAPLYVRVASDLNTPFKAALAHALMFD